MLLKYVQVSAILLIIPICIVSQPTSEEYFSAVINGDDMKVKDLSYRGFDVNSLNEDGKSALYLAAENNHHQIVEFLLKVKADPNIVEESQGWTPLIVAASNGYNVIVRDLLEYGADCEIADKYGQTAVWFVVFKSFTKVLNVLIEEGCDMNHGHEVTKVSPLLLAAERNNLKVMKQLLKHGADVNAANNQKVTPLIISAQNGNFEIITELLNQPDIDVNAAAIDSTTALFRAIQFRQQKIVQKLITQDNINVNTRCSSVKPFLAYSTMKVKGNEISANDLQSTIGTMAFDHKPGSTPFILSCNYGLIFVMKMLIHAGAEVDVTDYLNGTGLMRAKENNHQAIVTYLVDYEKKENHKKILEQQKREEL